MPGFRTSFHYKIALRYLQASKYDFFYQNLTQFLHITSNYWLTSPTSGGRMSLQN